MELRELMERLELVDVYPMLVGLVLKLQCSMWVEAKMVGVVGVDCLCPIIKMGNKQR